MIREILGWVIPFVIIYFPVYIIVAWIFHRYWTKKYCINRYYKYAYAKFNCFKYNFDRYKWNLEKHQYLFYVDSNDTSDLYQVSLYKFIFKNTGMIMRTPIDLLRAFFYYHSYIRKIKKLKKNNLYKLQLKDSKEFDAILGGKDK